MESPDIRRLSGTRVLCSNTFSSFYSVFWCLRFDNWLRNVRIADNRQTDTTAVFGWRAAMVNRELIEETKRGNEKIKWTQSQNPTGYPQLRGTCFGSQRNNKKQNDANDTTSNPEPDPDIRRTSGRGFGPNLNPAPKPRWPKTAELFFANFSKY